MPIEAVDPQQLIEMHPSPPTSWSELSKRQASLNLANGRDTYVSGLAMRSASLCGFTLDLEVDYAISWLNSLEDYTFAAGAECHELLDCINWKHWSVEAKSGKRWLINDEQNIRVEVIDLLFFLNSLAHLLTIDIQTHLYLIAPLEFENTPNKGKGIATHNLAISHSISNMHQIIIKLKLVAKTHSAIFENLKREVINAFLNWRLIVEMLGLSLDDIFNLYHQKWVINLQRVIRGRSQVGDTQSEIENKSVTV